MTEEPEHLNENERIEMDNQFLKMKLMLEHNAKFGSCEENKLPPELENMFLRNVMEFEKQFEDCKRIKVYDKIGRPDHFKPAAEISDQDIDEEWHRLREHLDQHSIYLDVCSPNIPNRELYRFTIEELFEHEMDDISIPGFGTNFIYDEFHPDPVYECSRVVTGDLFPDLFRPEPMFMEYCFVREGIYLNDKRFENFSELQSAVSNFKDSFEEINLIDCRVDQCDVQQDIARVKGNYQAEGFRGVEMDFFAGDYLVELERDELGYWGIRNMKIGGLLI